MEALIVFVGLGIIVVAVLVVRAKIAEGNRIDQERSQLVECRNCGKRFTRGKFRQERGCPSCGADYLDG